MKKLTVLVLVMLFLASSAMARTVTLTPTRDLGLYTDGTGGNNRGYGGRMDIGGSAVGLGHGALVAFDLSGVTLVGGEYISAVDLKVYSVKDSGWKGGVTVAGHAMLKQWQEGTGTTWVSGSPVRGSTGYPWGDCVVGDSSYNYQAATTIEPPPGTFSSGGNNYREATAGTAWGAVGARGLGSDVETTPLFSKALTGNGVLINQLEETFNFTTYGVSVVQKWEAATQANYGISMWDSAGSGNRIEITTLDFNWANAANTQPELILTIIPEPASWSLLVIGGLLALIRRRRK